MSGLENRLIRLLRSDSYLTPFSDQIRHRLENIEETEHRLTQGKKSLAEFASGHEYFGLHFQRGEWVFREWAPNATAIYLIGDMSKWQESKEFELQKDQRLWCLGNSPIRQQTETWRSVSTPYSLGRRRRRSYSSIRSTGRARSKNIDFQRPSMVTTTVISLERTQFQAT